MSEAAVHTPITLTNRTRFLSPAITFALCMVMFGPLLALTYFDGPTAKTVTGATVFLLCIVWCGISALRAPHTLTIDGGSLRIHRMRRETTYSIADIADWYFSIPDGLPTRSPPSTNALLQLKLADRTRFRAEVTAEEAAIVARHLLVPSPGRPGEG